MASNADEIDEFGDPVGGRFVESVPSDARRRCQNCPDSIEPGDWMVPDHHGLSRGRGWVHDECAD